MAFASRLRARFSGSTVPACPPPSKNREASMKICKIANSLDDVFIAEDGRVVKQISRGPMYSYTAVLQRVMALFRAPRRSRRLTRRGPSPQPRPPQGPHFLFSERPSLPARHGELAANGFGEVDQTGMVPCYRKLTRCSITIHTISCKRACVSLSAPLPLLLGH